MSLWTSDDSDALDRAVRESRKRERAERAGIAPPVTRDEAKRVTAAGSRYIGPLPEIGPAGGRPRRRKAPVPAQDSQAARSLPGRPLRPRPRPNGRWLAVINRSGTRRERTFNTEAEAQAWLNTMKEDDSWHT
ncbi:hypothetical protein [Nocardioides sp.]|uniref:hypothetical protein n=1 Tax=Nocardioides sp. TaxID=35761 RepID=UPI0037846EF0